LAINDEEINLNLESFGFVDGFIQLSWTEMTDAVCGV